LVNLFELYDDARTCQRQIYTRSIKKKLFYMCVVDDVSARTLQYIALTNYILLSCILGTKGGFHTLKLLNVLLDLSS